MIKFQLKLKDKNKNKSRTYYQTYIKKINKRCKDCNTLITFGNHLRCPDCHSFYKLKNSYYLTKSKLTKNIFFLIWFTGFWEGEGSVKEYKRHYQLKSGKIQEYIGFKICVYQKEKCNLYKIQKIFKFGGIYTLGHKNVCSVWSTDNLGEILALTDAMKPFIISSRRKKQLKQFLNYSKIRSICKRL